MAGVTPEGEELYATAKIEADVDTWIAEAQNDVQTYVDEAVTTARRLLAETPYDLDKALPLLLGDTEDDLGAHLLVRILVHEKRMAAAVKSGDILNVQRQTMHFTRAVERAMHQAACGRPVGQHRRRVELNRGNNARQHVKQAQFWAPWEAVFHQLVEVGWKPALARRKVDELMGEQGLETFDDRTLAKWLR